MISETLRADNGPDPARVRSRSLLLFLVSSIVVHALVFVLPFERRRDASITPPILEVMMMTQKAEETSPPLRKPQPGPAGQAAIRPKPDLRKAVLAHTPLPSELPLTELVPFAEADVPAAILPPAVGTQSGPIVTKQPEIPASAPVFNAAYLRNPAPRYPLAARRNGEEGTVMLRVLVGTEGSAARVQLDRSSGSASLDGAALEAVRRWRFVPAKRGSQSVEDWVRVPIVFKLEGAS